MTKDCLAYEKFEEARRIDPGFSEAHSRAAFFWQAQATPTMQDSNLYRREQYRDSTTTTRNAYDLAIATARTAIDRRILEAEKAFSNCACVVR